MADSVKLESIPPSNLIEASVFNPSFLEPFRMTPGLKLADSKTMVFVFLLMPASFPPFIPAIANGFSESAIIKISLSKL